MIASFIAATCGRTTAPVPDAAVLSITTAGSMFAPAIIVDDGADVLWTFADESTSSSLTPSVDYGSAATRVSTLAVSPPEALLAVHLGYDGADEGTTSPVVPDLMSLTAPQGVSDIAGLSSATGLQVVTCSGCPITSLDLSGMSSVVRVECRESELTEFVVAGCTALQRFSVELNAITNINVSDCAALNDLRATGNTGLASVTFGGTGAALQHLCAWGNPLLGLPPLTQMSTLNALLIAGNGQTGVIDLTDVFPAGRGAMVEIGSAGVTGVILDGCDGIVQLEVRDSALDQAAVDSALVAMEAFGTSGNTIVLTGNSVPSATGLAARDSLVGRGWTVEVDS